MKRTAAALLTASALILGACGVDGAEEAADAKSGASDTASETTAAPAEDAVAKFGDLASPCGEGNATVSADDAGALGTDKLRIAVANDRTSIRTGLDKELWDATTAFVGWCNAQGGIQGLELEAVDVDGRLFDIEPAMATTCTNTFALVGGGWAQDDMAFTGKPESDFGLCGQIAIAGFAVSERFSLNDRVVNSLPNSPTIRPMAHFQALAKLHPDKVKKFAIAYGGIQSMEDNKNQNMAALAQLPEYGEVKTYLYGIAGQDWSVFAQQIIADGIEALAWIGEPQMLAQFSQALKDRNWDGVIIAETNVYDERFLEIAGPQAVEGVYTRGVAPPFEEADNFPATKQLMEILDQYSPGWTQASLAVQSFSAALLFATVADECADEGPITRDCVLGKAKAVNEWTAGGLHPSGNPAKKLPAECTVLNQVRNGAFVRAYPELDSADADSSGLYCTEPITVG